MLTRMHPRGFTLAELVVAMLALLILAAILFPVFARSPHHTRQSQCLNNQKQIATALQMHTQDNEEIYFTLPATPWPLAIAAYCESKVYDCDKKTGKGSDRAPEYGFNSVLSGVALGDIQYHASTPVTADLEMRANRARMYPRNYSIIDWNADIDARHSSGVFMSFVDGHVQMVNFSGVEDKMLFTLISRGFNPYDGAGTVVYEQAADSTLSGAPVDGALQIATSPLDDATRRGNNYYLSGDISVNDVTGAEQFGIAVGAGTGGNWKPCARVGYNVTAQKLIADAGARIPRSTKIALPPAASNASYTFRLVVLKAGATYQGYATVLKGYTVLAATTFPARALPPNPRAGAYILSEGTSPAKMTYKNIRLNRW